MKDTRRHISQADLEEVIRRIVQTAQPDRIILFGSAARGAMGANSDIDLLVIKGGAVNRNKMLGEIYRGLRGFHVAVDVLLATPEEEVYPEDLCFNAQQAAEKAIEALLIAHGVRFPYVHDIGLLLTLLEDAGVSVPQDVANSVILTQSGKHHAQ